MNRTHAHARRAAAAAATCLCALVGLSVLAVPVAAHGGGGTLAVVSTEPQADGTSVKVTVQLNFSSDGHPAEDATVTVVGELEGGGPSPEFTPVTLAAAGPEGQYAGVVRIPAPGTWNLRVTSVEPPATATTRVATAATARTEDSLSAPTTTAAPTTSPTSAAESTTPSEPAEDGSSTLVTGALVGVVGGVVAVLVVGAAARRKKAAEASAGATDGDGQD